MPPTDRVVSAPALESQEERDAARAKARSSAGPSGWFKLILDHHEQVEKAIQRA